MPVIFKSVKLLFLNKFTAGLNVLTNTTINVVNAWKFERFYIQIVLKLDVTLQVNIVWTVNLNNMKIDINVVLE